MRSYSIHTSVCSSSHIVSFPKVSNLIHFNVVVQNVSATFLIFVHIIVNVVLTVHFNGYCWNRNLNLCVELHLLYFTKSSEVNRTLDPLLLFLLSLHVWLMLLDLLNNMLFRFDLIDDKLFYLPR